MPDTREDIVFTALNLTNNAFSIANAVAGGLAVQDNQGRLVLVPQRQDGGNVVLDFRGFAITGQWRIVFPKGRDGVNTTGGITATEAIVYSLVFG